MHRLLLCAVGLALIAPAAQAAQDLHSARREVRVDIMEGGRIRDITLQAGVPVTLVLRSVAQSPGDIFSPELMRLAHRSAVPIRLAATDSIEITLTPERPGRIDLAMLGFTFVHPPGPPVRSIYVVG